MIPAQIARPRWCIRFDEDQGAAATTRHALLAELADTDTLVIGTHFATPTAGYIETDADGYPLKIDS